MAELEIHYPDGLVGYKTLTEDSQLLFGSGSSCDVKVEGSGVARKHFLIRYHSGAWRFDVNKDADGVTVNGQDSKGGKLSADDELALGEYVFIVRLDGAGDASPMARAAPPRGATSAAFDEEDYFKPFWKNRTFQVVCGTLVGLVLLGGIGYLLYHGARANKIYNDSRKRFDENAHKTAADGFHTFWEEYPADPRAGKAKVYERLAQVRAMEESGAQLDQAQAEAEKLVSDMQDMEEFKDVEIAPEIGTTLTKIADDFAKKARDRLDKRAYENATGMMKVLERAYGKDGEISSKAEPVREVLKRADYRIRRDDRFRAVLAKMDESLANKRPVDIYNGHRNLYQQYPELRDANAKDDSKAQEAGSALLERRAKAREVEKALVTFVAGEEAGGDAKPVMPVPARTVVHRKPGGTDSGKAVVIQAADALYSLDAGSGKALKQRPAGLDPAFPPLPIGSGEQVLVHQPLDKSIALLDAASLNPVWRTPIGPVRYTSRPALQEGNIYLTGVDEKDANVGRLYVFNQATGKYSGYYRFPQPLAGLPVWYKQRRSLLLPGSQASLFMVDPARKACQAVLPLDHEPGTLFWLPKLAGRFLFAVENQAPERTRLRCLVMAADQDNLSEKNIGPLANLQGAVRHDPEFAGTRLFIATDQDAFVAYDLGGEEDEKVLSLAHKYASGGSADRKSREAPYIYPLDPAKLWMVGQRASYFELRPGTVDATVLAQVNLAGPAAAPPMLVGRTLVVAVRKNDKGAITVTGIDADSHAEIWVTELAEVPAAVQWDPLESTCRHASLSIL